MLARCRGYTELGRRYYRDRGISVCPRWQESFEAFYADMGSRPSADHSLDRIDNERGYEPDNCRWATWTEQHRNTRQTRLFAFNGETRCLTEWAALYGISPSGLRRRLNCGMDIAAALTTPKQRRG